MATRSFVLSSYKRNSSHNRTSLNVGQPLRSSSRLSRTDSADTAKHESWFTRLKISVLRLLGQDPTKDAYITRLSTLPISSSDICHVERVNFGDEPDTDNKLRNTRYTGSENYKINKLIGR